MKKSHFLTALQVGAMTLLCVLFALSSLSAQNGGNKKNKAKTFDYDLTEQITNLPKTDGEHLIKDDGKVKIYAVVSNGELDGLKVTDKKGNPLASAEPPKEATSSDTQAKKRNKCVCCYCWSNGGYGCITIYQEGCKCYPL